MILVVRLFIFMVLWVGLGSAVTHFFYPELSENESTKTAIPWLLLIGYVVGTFSLGLAEGISKALSRRG